jgi:hypothetical protein
MARVTTSVAAARAAAIRFFGEEGDNERDRVIMARALGSLFVAGAVVGFVSLLLPHWDGGNEGGVGAVCVIALVFGLLLAFEDGRLPSWAFPTACYAATVLIALALYLSDVPDSPYAFYFVLVGMFSAYFL